MLHGFGAADPIENVGSSECAERMRAGRPNANASCLERGVRQPSTAYVDANDWGLGAWVPLPRTSSPVTVT